MFKSATAWSEMLKLGQEFTHDNLFYGGLNQIKLA
jgi:hypothetical protein